MQTAFIIGLGLGLLPIGAAAQDEATAPTRAATVLVDNSQEYLFVYDYLAGFLRSEGYKATINRGTLKPELLKAYDIVVLQQMTTKLAFDPKFVDAVETWVKSGGRLILVAQGTVWKTLNPDSGDMPFNTVARRFGFEFDLTTRADLPLKILSHSITKGLPDEFAYDDYDPRARTFKGWTERYGIGVLKADGAIPIVTDANGKVWMALRSVGRGEVVAFTGKRTIWGATNPPDIQHNPRSQQLIRGLFEYMGREAKPRPNVASLPDLIMPDVVLRKGDREISTTAALRERSQFCLDQFDRIYNVLYDYFKVHANSKLRLTSLATGGGGYRGGDEVGIGVLAPDDGVRGLLLWELTNGWGPPIPDSWGEHWAFHVSMYVRGRASIDNPSGILGGRFANYKEVADVDPAFDKLDMSKFGDDQIMHRKVVLKASMVVKEMEDTYPDFVPRLCRIDRMRHGDEVEVVDMQEFVYMCSLAAGADLYPFFQSTGTTVQSKPIDFAEGPRCLAEYEAAHPDEPKL